jgi:hypothetical protein
MVSTVQAVPREWPTDVRLHLSPRTRVLLHAAEYSADFLASQQFLNAIQSHESINLKQLSSLCANVSSGAGESLTFWHHMIITIPAKLWGLIFTRILVCLWGLLLAGGMTEKQRNHKPVLPICLSSSISNNLNRALSCLRLSGHNFLVQRMRHNRNRRPYELRICYKCDWHSVQDEEHILLDCPHEHLVSLRTQHRQLVFPSQYDPLFCSAALVFLTQLPMIFLNSTTFYAWTFFPLRSLPPCLLFLSNRPLLLPFLFNFLSLFQHSRDFATSLWSM